MAKHWKELMFLFFCLPFAKSDDSMLKLNLQYRKPEYQLQFLLPNYGINFTGIVAEKISDNGIEYRLREFIPVDINGIILVDSTEKTWRRIDLDLNLHQSYIKLLANVNRSTDYNTETGQGVVQLSIGDVRFDYQFSFETQPRIFSGFDVNRCPWFTLNHSIQSNPKEVLYFRSEIIQVCPQINDMQISILMKSAAWPMANLDLIQTFNFNQNGGEMMRLYHDMVNGMISAYWYQLGSNMIYHKTILADFKRWFHLKGEYLRILTPGDGSYLASLSFKDTTAISADNHGVLTKVIMRMVLYGAFVVNVVVSMSISLFSILESRISNSIIELVKPLNLPSFYVTLAVSTILPLPIYLLYRMLTWIRFGTIARWTIYLSFGAISLLSLLQVVYENQIQEEFFNQRI